MKCQRCPKQATLHITEVLGEDASVISRKGLTPHPRVAFLRRINRGLITVALVAAVPVGLGLWLSPTLVRIGLIGAGIFGGSATIWTTSDAVTWTPVTLAPTARALHVVAGPDDRD